MYNFINYLRYICVQKKQLFLVCALLGNQLLMPMQMRSVVYPREFLELSGTVKNMINDIRESDDIIIPLPGSEETINDVFTIFALYNSENEPQNSVRKEVASYPLDRLVYVVNLLQYLHVIDDIMDVVMDQVSEALNTILDASLQSLYKPSPGIIQLPYYEALRLLNPDAENTIKKSFSVQNTLQWRIAELWKFVGRKDFTQEVEQFKQGNEKIASFLDRNFFEVMKQFSEKQQQNFSSDLSKNDASMKSSNANIVLGATIAAAILAGLWKLYDYLTQQK